MISATPDITSRLGLLDVVLRSVDANAPLQISDQLKDHIVAVLRAAAAISAHPESIAADTLPEAIELALRIRDNAALRTNLAQLQAFDGIGPEIAKGILKSLKPIAA